MSDKYAINGKLYKEFFDIEKFISMFDEDDTINNYSPIIQKNLGLEYQKGIVLSGEFKTDYSQDSIEDKNGFCFIQFRKRDSGNSSVKHGYGVVFRPSFVSSGSLTYSITNVKEISTGRYDLTVTGITSDVPKKLFIQKEGIIPFGYDSIEGGIIKNAKIS